MTPEGAITNSQTSGPKTQPAPAVSHRKWFTAAGLGVIVGGCGIVVLLGLICVGAWFCVTGGVGSEPANIPTAERVTREFVEALHNGNVQSAHQMLAEETQAKQSPDQLASLLETDYIKKYQSLEVCEFGLFFTDTGRILAAKGILHYEGGTVFFESNLSQESDGTWRIYGFRLRPDIAPAPWGACQ
ncbi:MAG: hypothetical protein KKA73_18695 [Chloroflexi bacterium]|nr:hypothetical protein [Chloroflexota bacterium]